jgi:hypothetical protein
MPLSELQKGHPGHTLSPVENLDQIFRHALNAYL